MAESYQPTPESDQPPPRPNLHMVHHFTPSKKRSTARYLFAADKHLRVNPGVLENFTLQHLVTCRVKLAERARQVGGLSSCRQNFYNHADPRGPHLAFFEENNIIKVWIFYLADHSEPISK